MSRYRTRSWRAFDPGAARPLAYRAGADAAGLRILGLDPGSRRTGYGVIERRGADWVHVAHGCVTVAAAGRSLTGAAARHLREPARAHRHARPGRSCHRAGVRQQECRQRAQARPGPRGGTLRRAEGAAGVRIRAARHQARPRGLGCGGEGAGGSHDPHAARAPGAHRPRCRRCARRGRLSRALAASARAGVQAERSAPPGAAQPYPR